MVNVRTPQGVVNYMGDSLIFTNALRWRKRGLYVYPERISTI